MTTDSSGSSHALQCLHQFLRMPSESKSVRVSFVFIFLLRSFRSATSGFPEMRQMHDMYGKWMSPFEFFLRTGRRVPVSATISLKFNPWHDPDDGRFTFRDQGTNYGGGRSGGDGGSGSAPSPKRKPTASGVLAGGGPGFNGGGSRGGYPAPPAKNDQSTAIRHVTERNGYRFGFDDQRRTLIVKGPLKFPKTTERSRTSQLQAGGSDRRSDDDGGHYIAARFSGPKDAFNHFAQNASFNRGGYRVMENGWAKELRAGKRVRVNIAVSYKGSSKRPDALEVRWTINGQPFAKSFGNQKDHRR